MNFDPNLKLIPCLPPLYARTGHMQTILGHALPSPEIKETDEVIKIGVSGGDTLVTHLFRGNSQVVVYLFHGLGGFSHAFYMQRTALLARRLGHTVFMTNHRGCGLGKGLAREPYHSGRADDLAAVISYGRELFPNHVHLAVGFSLSANALLLLAAEQRGKVLPDAAIAVNAPIDLEKCAHLLKVGVNRIYDVRFMRDMRLAVRSRREAGHALHEFHVRWNASLHDFDDLYTAPAGGFTSREDYYQTCSAQQYLPAIKIPTVILTASDDPFVPVSSYREARVSSKASMHIERFGGHMGYISAQPTPLGSKRWLDYALHTLMTSLRF